MNKTIYMTYKKAIPDLVGSRWKTLNKDYEIELSLDDDCIRFLETHFNSYIANLFKQIPIGMYKADLWRLCKLYVHGGVYADVDLIPYLDIDKLDVSASFYTCLSKNPGAVFQAFIISKPPGLRSGWYFMQARRNAALASSKVTVPVRPRIERES